MNEFDQCVKHELLISHYARYTDDFIIVSDSRAYLEQLIPIIQEMLQTRLKLTLHPQKVLIQSYHRGVDFLGYIIFPHYQLMRTRTKKRMIRKLRERATEYRKGLITQVSLNQSIQSYLGALSHANSYKMIQYLKNQLWWYTRG